MCSAALFTLRKREPHLQRPHRVFGYPWIPGIALFASAVLLLVFVIGNAHPSLLALAVVVATYPLFRLLQRNRSTRPPPG